MDYKNSNIIALIKARFKLCLSLFFIVALFSAIFSLVDFSTPIEPLETSTITTKETISTEFACSEQEIETPAYTETTYFLSETDKISAPYAGLYEVFSFTAIYEKEAQSQIYPASLTKVLTAITALSYVSPETVFTVGSEQDLVPERSSLCLIKKGHKLTLYDLLTGMLIASGNDAAYTIAVNTARIVIDRENISDKEALSYFSSLMNTAAKTVGANHSHFINPDGFDNAEQYTTIRDLAAICRYALGFKEIREIIKYKEKYVVFESGENVTWTNSNQLLNPNSPYYFPAARGMKTGTTPLAGKCLIALADINGKSYIAVVAGCDSEESRYSSVLNLFSPVYSI